MKLRNSSRFQDNGTTTKYEKCLFTAVLIWKLSLYFKEEGCRMNDLIKEQVSDIGGH